LAASDEEEIGQECSCRFCEGLFRLQDVYKQGTAASPVFVCKKCRSAGGKYGRLMKSHGEEAVAAFYRRKAESPAWYKGLIKKLPEQNRQELARIANESLDEIEAFHSVSTNRRIKFFTMRHYICHVRNVQGMTCKQANRDWRLSLGI